MQKEQSKQNKMAWEYRAYEHWVTNYGTPEKMGKHIRDNTDRWLNYYKKDLGNVSGKKIANLLGSGGIRAVALAVLGADVTIVDISEENARYARELSKEANVNINYIVSDLFDIPIKEMKSQFDIVFMEFGILHYFSDLEKLGQIIVALLKENGKLILRDFHPFSKIVQVNEKEGTLILKEGYFNETLHFNPVAYEGFFPEEEQKTLPKTYLRKWTFSDIITSFAQQGFIIKKMYEEPDKGNQFIPANYMIVAIKSN
ncbi:class I SAM-dependent methyltransferase [Bacillus sp. FJAT-49711]|uniref:class I SAM-dependent methyltransferase n=1 Tax=Bacillus sp. FJAT-49711 TaxID=2833585 RepID=UPI001BCA278C|nr:class I SAM-dependent methyltransferase [Bacillus sp. FJAT-49711]MBS4220310.1 class I SAM-dependent methyltransferase [Bacillus sp. FJAT-49711]